ncbi:hypothetical protein CANTEDRAFT_114212 [Yamadazyma tenuis ATCC 10573]|uniref:Uncharacterized protein n=3 Tax=Candida tenuis TaxID=2315449 RepID=G3B3H5_CANTC|nr:uncharacterized protein CANTEDRAFT_114212 [Yamadazyma tenuis ATCC 10573]EGV64164.1 hypothetical protein CANTEDRAFT_114212 [Yamadazyma tenuis ATCC 10573]
MTTYQFQILLVKLPAYDTSFLGELISNLESLAVVFGTLPETVPNLRVLRTQYYTLMDFIKLDLLPMLNHKKIDNKVINYPVDCIYNLLKKWYTIFPSASFLPVTPHNDLVTSDLRSTIFSYYYVVGAALRVCFPQTPYLFGVSFATLQTYAARRFFEISPSVNSLNIGTNLQDSLQRHNYYALRLYSFLRHRVRIFIKGIEWESEFPEDRSANRAFKNVMEVPIKSFADTLVRPEHYATIRYEDREPGHRFVRTDETMISQLYARNIETLKFFDGNCVLQFDYQSMALLRDYRPIPSTGIVNFPDITVTDLDYYMEDRRHIIRNFKQNV